MKKITFIITVFFFSFLFTLVSCKKDEEVTTNVSQEDEEGINKTAATNELNTVESEKSPRSNKIETEFEVDGTVYNNPDDVYTDTDTESQSKIELLINGTASSSVARLLNSDSAFAWITSTENGASLENQKKDVYVFTIDGKYLKFSNETKTADWGYYYLNNDVSKIGFDFVNQTIEKKFSVNRISSEKLELTKNGVVYGFKPYIMEQVKSNKFDTNIKNVVIPIDSTQIPEDTTSTLPIEFLKISEPITEDTLDVFTIEADRLGGPDSSNLYYLQIELVTESDTTILESSIIYTEGFQTDTDTSANPIIMGGTDIDSFSATVKINNVGLSIPRTYRFMIVNESLNFKSFNITN